MTNSNRTPVRRGIPLGYVLAAVFSVEALVVAIALLAGPRGWF